MGDGATNPFQLEVNPIMSLLSLEYNLKAIDEEYGQIFKNELEKKIEKRKRIVMHIEFPKFWKSIKTEEYDYLGVEFFQYGYKEVVESITNQIEDKMPNILDASSINIISNFEKILASCDGLLDYIGDSEIELSSDNIINPFKEEYINAHIGEIMNSISIYNDNVKNLSEIYKECASSEHTEYITQNLTEASVLDKNISEANLNLSKLEGSNYENLKETILELKKYFLYAEKVTNHAKSSIDEIRFKFKKMPDKDADYFRYALNVMGFEFKELSGNYIASRRL
ncbi:MAG: hypothetical protein KAH93_05490 [Candidatus Aenigmarchaeota archaeon]|nr:hypothetical protein [Candidatus Aenigmarchaeota archaeon]